MLKTALKIAVVLVALGSFTSEASAFGHRHCGWGGCGWGGCGWGGCGYGLGYYGGWGYGGWGYPGYWGPGMGYYAGSPSRATTSTATNNALLTVDVPAEAKIFVNDRPTTSTGPVRQYISRDLQPGTTYSYKVRAEYMRDDKPVSEEKTVQLTAGQITALDFTETRQKVADNSTPPRR